MGPLKASAGFLQREQTTALVSVANRRALPTKFIKASLRQVDSQILSFLLNRELSTHNVSAGDRVTAEHLL